MYKARVWHPANSSFVVAMVLALILTACGGTPAVTEQPTAATVAPTEASAPAVTAAPEEPTAPAEMTAAPTSETEATAETPATTAEATAAPATTPAQEATTSPAAARPAPDGTLTVVQALLPLTADPHVEYLNTSWSVNYAIYDPLARVDEAGVLQPYLATSWEVETPTSWIFHLRENVKWHDGTPFTADDVVWSVKRLLDPETKSIWTGIYSYVSGAEAVDQQTVRISTKTTSVAVPQDFGRMAMLPKAQFEKMGKDAFLQHPIGTGPFKFSKQVAGEEITLVANEDYWGDVPLVKTLLFKQVPDAATRVAELLAGTADIVDAIPPNEIERINASGSSTVVAAPTVRRILLEFAITTTKELEDRRVREAVAHAIDTDTLNQALYGGKAGAQTGWLDHASWGYDKALKPYAYDPEKSKQLLAEAGYPDGMPITFTMGKGRFLLDEEVGLAISDYLSKAGFKVDFQTMEWGTFSKARTSKTMQGIYMLSSGNSTGEPDQVFRSFDTKRESIYISDPKLDEMIHQQAAETDRAKREPMVAAVDAYIHDQVLSVNLLTVPGFYGVNSRTEGFKPSPFEIFSFANISVK